MRRLTRGWVVLVNVKLLLDENISPGVAEELRKEGVDVCGVRDRNLLEADDHAVLEKAYLEDRVLVTKNVGDFEKLVRARDCIAGRFRPLAQRQSANGPRGRS